MKYYEFFFYIIEITCHILSTIQKKYLLIYLIIILLIQNINESWFNYYIYIRINIMRVCII